MATLRDSVEEYPHIAVRETLDASEAFVIGTGLAVWEIAWLARLYDGDAMAISRHTGADPDLVDEGLRYASDHAAEIKAEVASHTERTLEDLLEEYPRIRVVHVNMNGSDEQTQ